MAHIKQNMCQHLRSAKEWLTKAEEAFDKQHDVRAELDLMLAQAELQHVKETNRSRQWRYKYLAFRHGLALTLAMCMAVAVGGVYWWTTKPELVAPVPLAEQARLPVGVAPQGNNILPVERLANSLILPLSQKAEPLPQIEQSRQVEQPRQVEQRRLVEQPRQEEQPVALSADDMQKLVRAAGKSLRGQ